MDFTEISFLWRKTDFDLFAFHNSEITISQVRKLLGRKALRQFV